MYNRRCYLLPFLVFCEDDIVKESSGPKFAMYFTVTPVAERTSIAWTYVAKDYEALDDDETRSFEDAPSPCKTSPSWNPSVPNSCRSTCKPNCISAPTAPPLLIASGLNS